MTTIYVIEKNNIPIYVGKTVNFNVRKFYHRKKYGDDITWFFIDQVNDNEWKFWEKHYISLFKSWGFKLTNQNKGGGGSTSYTKEQCVKISNIKKGMKYKISEESKKNKSKKLTGLKRSDETKIKISKSKIGHSCYNDEFKKKISNSTPLKKTIIQYTLDDIKLNTFTSAKEAGRYLNKSGNSIADCAAGKQKTAYGFKWKYKINLAL
jgi:hypothetical protein